MFALKVINYGSDVDLVHNDLSAAQHLSISDSLKGINF
jgi:hypothetical protein